MNIADKVLSLHLPSNSYIVVGSGILDALNIRKASDIDLIVSNDVFEKLRGQGWKEGTWMDQKVLKHDLFDAGRLWSGKSIDELLETATIIDNVPFLNLIELRQWKTEQARPKDLEDMVLIDKYLATHP